MTYSSVQALNAQCVCERSLNEEQEKAEGEDHCGGFMDRRLGSSGSLNERVAIEQLVLK